VSAKAAGSAREVALETILRVHETGSYAHILLSKALERSHLNSRDRALVTELVYGSLRAEGTLDWVLSLFAARPLSELSPEIRDILRLGAYQILYTSKIPAHAATNESVELAKKYGGVGVARFVNAVLRHLIREKDKLPWPSLEKDPVSHVSLVYSHPRWLVEMWTEELGLDETIALCKANNVRPRLVLRTNTLKISRDELKQRLEGRRLRVLSTLFAPEGLMVERAGAVSEFPEFKEGLFQVQDESSMLASHLVKPESGEVVLDLCAAPGGKTTHLGALMKNRGRIIAIDLHAHRLKLIEENCKRLGVEIVELIQGNATRLEGLVREKVERILVDAPCSGLGTLARRPDSRWRKSPEAIKQLALLQSQLLESASSALKENGVVVYATCTISRRENAEVVEEFLKKHPEFLLEKASDYLPVKIPSEHEWIQLLPHVHHTQGFFMARLLKRRQR
jgi:16S rRNA (cytosine967-C5)-methyltransferase